MVGLFAGSIILEAANQTELDQLRLLHTRGLKGTDKLLDLEIMPILANAETSRRWRPTFCNVKADTAVNEIFPG